MADNESSSRSNSSDAPVAEPINCWKYSRDVYLIGRSINLRPFTAEEREAVKTFIAGMAATRPSYIPYIQFRGGNPPVCVYQGEGNARTLVWDLLDKQNDISLAKMVQKIGRTLKIQYCNEDEKALCDALFAATDVIVTVNGEEVVLRRYQTYYMEPSEEEQESSSESSSESESSSSSESSSEVVEQESSSSESSESSETV